MKPQRKSRKVSLQCVREPAVGFASQRTAAIGLHFGIPLYGKKVEVLGPTTIRLDPGKIVLVVGPSGSGKSSALGQVERQCPGGCVVHRVVFPRDAAIIDRIAPWASLGESIAMLTTCGIGEPHLWVRRFHELSDGEKFRARLARAVALLTRSRGVAPLICDEYCSALHRRVAKAISYNLRKLVDRRGLTVVLACSNDDVIADLRPDVIVRLHGNGRCDAKHADPRSTRRPSFLRRLKIERGTLCDYHEFASMHYRAVEELGFIDKVFVLRDCTAGDALGIVVYGHSPLELRLRNQATGMRFSRNPGRVNNELRILRRLVVHPDVRGCGVGYYLVRKTLPLVGTPYVECLAAMGEFNPVFEKAGMKRIGQYEISGKRRAALEALRAMEVDPNSREFPMHVCRKRRVREIVSRIVADWYSATTVNGEVRLARQTPVTLAQTFRGLAASRPVYYLWTKGEAA